MSKQVIFSARISALTMAMFALLATFGTDYEAGADTDYAAVAPVISAMREAVLN